MVKRHAAAGESEGNQFIDAVLKSETLQVGQNTESETVSV